MAGHDIPPIDPVRLMEEATVELEHLRARLAARGGPAGAGAPIAIVGAGCRLPGSVRNFEEYWQLLLGGVDAIREVPAERWAIDALYNPDPYEPGRIASRYGGFLDAVDHFDAAFFNVAPREAQAMDPQQRLCLEVAWEALEHASIAVDRRSPRNGGVFLGMTTSDYAHLLLRVAGPEAIDAWFASGNTANAAAGRLAYTLGFRGPAMAVDSACSSSLVAVHLACRSLRSGECDIALAGGVNLILSPEGSIATSRARLLAPDGRCKGFSAQADGYVRSEGCAVAALRRLEDALADGDPILAVIRGTAVNQDGASAGPTVPNGAAQEEVIRAALKDAGLRPGDIQVAEAHGTGTALGDPIELRALAATYGEGRAGDRRLVVGSAKSNLGHCEAAAGIVGLLKASAMVAQGAIPPHLHCSQPTPQVDWHALPLRIAGEPVAPWPEGQGVRRTGVSSFGFSGTNAHAIVEQPPLPASADGWDSEAHIYPLSARSPAALRALGTRHADALAHAPEARLAGRCRTAGEGRIHHRHRLAVVAGSREAFGAALAAHGAGESHADLLTGHADEPPVLAMMFSGQGAQRAGSGQALYACQPVFRAAIDACTDLAREGLGRPLRDVMFGAPGDGDIHRTAYTQPALVALEISLYRLWRHWGVEPLMVFGHSVGEIAAAHAAGILDLADAMRLAVARGALMQAVDTPGTMAAAMAPVDRVRALIAAEGLDVAIAAINGPEQTTVSGHRDAIEAALAAFRRHAVEAQPLRVSHAFHSPLMEPVIGPLREVLEGLRWNAPLIRFVPALGDGAPAVDTPDYWCRQVLEPVNFAGAVSAAACHGCQVHLELGPASVLVGMGRQSRREAGVDWIPTLAPGVGEMVATRKALAALYVRGAPVDWRGVWGGAAARRERLPTYAWEHKRFWVPEPVARPGSVADGGEGMRRIHPPECSDLTFDGVLTLGRTGHLGDHRLGETVVVAGATHLAAVLSAARCLPGEGALVIEDVLFSQALILRHGEEVRIGLRLSPASADGFSFELHSCPVSSAVPQWTLHAAGAIARDTATPRRRVAPAVPAQMREGADFYEDLAAKGYALGPRFRWLARLGTGSDAGRAYLERPDQISAAEDAAYPIHPGLIDSCFQLFSQLVSEDLLAQGEVLVPFRIARIRADVQAIRGPSFAEARLQPDGAVGALRGAVTLTDGEGAVLLDIEGFEGRATPLMRLIRPPAAGRYRLRWEAVAQSAEADLPGTWLVAGEGPLADRLAQALAQRGAAVTRARARKRTAGFGRLRCDGIALVLPRGPSFASDADTLQSAQREGAEALTALVQAVLAQGSEKIPRIRVITQTAEASLGGDGLAHATIAPMVQAIRAERPDLDLASIDLATGLADEPVMTTLVESLAEGPQERRRAIHVDGGRVRHLVARLAQCPEPAGAPFAARQDGTYLITGGGGLLGRLTARWLAERGAGHVVLTGRGLEPEQGNAFARQLETADCRITCLRCDVADPEAMAGLFEQMRAEGPPLRGIVHSAGLLDDALIENQSAARLAKVLRPKLNGAVLLDALSAGDPLDLFLLYSSAAALLGGPGQSNYAAANGLLDGLAWDRRRRGLPGTAIAWGPWDPSLGGFTAGATDFRARLAAHGLAPLETGPALAALDLALAGDDAQVAILDADWGRLASAGAANPLWAHLLPASGPDGDIGTAPLADELRGLDPAARVERLERAILAQLTMSLGLEPERIGRKTGFFELGMDSLSALEFRNRLQRDLGLTLSPTIAFQYPTVAALTQWLNHQGVLAAHDPAAVTPSPVGDALSEARNMASVASLSDEDLERLVDQELQALLR